MVYWRGERLLFGIDDHGSNTFWRLFCALILASLIFKLYHVTNYQTAIGMTAATLLTIDTLTPQSPVLIDEDEASFISRLNAIHWERPAILYQFWVWLAFAINTGMTFSILARIRFDPCVHMLERKSSLNHDSGCLGIYVHRGLLVM
jgi:hypothetical protein